MTILSKTDLKRAYHVYKIGFSKDFKIFWLYGIMCVKPRPYSIVEFTLLRTYCLFKLVIKAIASDLNVVGSESSGLGRLGKMCFRANELSYPNGLFSN